MFLKLNFGDEITCHVTRARTSLSKSDFCIIRNSGLKIMKKSLEISI